jgi:transposase-like protein
MPWKGVTVSEQRQRFLEDYRLNYYSISELAERFGISRRTAHKWIARFDRHGLAGYREQSRRPLSCPWQTAPAITEELVRQRKAHPPTGVPASCSTSCISGTGTGSCRSPPRPP